MFEFSDHKKDALNSELNGIIDFIKTKNLKFELVGFFLILMAGVLSRLIFINAYPNHPISDFYNILDLALAFEQDILAKGNIYWQYFSAGLPLILSILFRIIPYPSEDVARWATAVISGLPAVLPFLIWKDIFSRRVRILAGLLLVLWPGQILFSGTIAQDNWIIFPTVGLAALAVRALVVKKGGYPIWAGLFYLFSVAVRQEMLIALIPVAVVAILGSRREKWLQNFVMGVVLIGIFFSALIIQRGMATGRYTLSTQHLGVSILGAYVPGAGMGWNTPWSYLSIYHPEILGDENFDQQATRLAMQEFIRRPRFHIIRIIGSSLYNLFNIDKEIAPWGLSIEGVLSHRYRKSAKALQESLIPLLQFYPQLIHGLFLSAVFFSLSSKQLLKWISPILLTIIFKLGLHAAIVSQPRYFLAVVALEILVIAILWDTMLKKENWKLTLRSIFLGIVSVFLLISIMNTAKEYIEKHDVIFQPSYMISAYRGAVELPVPGHDERYLGVELTRVHNVCDMEINPFVNHSS